MAQRHTDKRVTTSWGPWRLPEAQADRVGLVPFRALAGSIYHMAERLSIHATFPEVALEALEFIWTMLGTCFLQQ